jgi:hypothetical protein
MAKNQRIMVIIHFVEKFDKIALRLTSTFYNEPDKTDKHGNSI